MTKDWSGVILLNETKKPYIKKNYIMTKDNKNRLDILEDYKVILEDYIGKRSVAETLEISQNILKSGDSLGLWVNKTHKPNNIKKLPIEGAEALVWDKYNNHINFEMELPTYEKFENKEAGLIEWVLELGTKILERIKTFIKEIKNIGEGLYKSPKPMILTTAFVSGVLAIQVNSNMQKKDESIKRNISAEDSKKDTKTKITKKDRGISKNSQDISEM